MVNKNERKYIFLIVLFTVLFFICMSICFVKFHALSNQIRINSLSYRLEAIALDEKMFGPDHIFHSLYFDSDYESKFDDYWEFADIYLAFVKGRYADNKTPYIAQITNYKATTTNELRQTAAEHYLEVLSE